MIDLRFQDAVAIITLNRPAKHHAIDKKMMDHLASVLSEIDNHPQVRAILITAFGEASFCAGGDLHYFTTLNSAEKVRRMSEQMTGILNRLWLGDKPVIAAINGQALGGGCEILTACHFRIAVPEANFSFRQVANGIITGWGGGLRLLHLLGRDKALKLLLSAQSLPADAALRTGLIDEIVPRQNLLSRAIELAGMMTEHPRPAIRAFLELANRWTEIELQNFSEFEKKKFIELWQQKDFQNFLKNYRQK